MFKTTRFNYISMAIVLVLAVVLSFLYLLQRQDVYDNIKVINQKLIKEEKKYYDSLTDEWSETLSMLVSHQDFRRYIDALEKGQKTKPYKRKIEKIFSKISSGGINKIQMIRFIDHLGEEKIVTKNGDVVTEYSQLNDKNFFRLGMVTPAGELSKVAFETQDTQSYLHRSVPVVAKNKRLGMLAITVDIKSIVGRYEYLLSANVVDTVALLSPQGEVLYRGGLTLSSEKDISTAYELMSQNSENFSLLEHEKNVWSFVKSDEYGFSVIFFSSGKRITAQLNSEYIKLSIVLLISVFVWLFLLINAKRRVPALQKNEVKNIDVIAQQRSHNFASISDEIRQPINALLGSLATLSETKLDTLQSDYTCTAKRSANRLLELVNQFQDYSKMTRGEFELDNIEFDLRSTVHDIAELVSGEAYKKGLEVSCLVSSDVPKRVIGDVTRLRQVMINLASYAVRYTASGEISLYLSAEDHSPNMTYINIEISDTGNIMDQETMAQQIAMFTTIADLDLNDEAQCSGEGLGLALSKQMVELMSGKIDLCENSHGGNTFRIQLPFPVVTKSVQQAKPHVSSQSDIDGKRILLVGEIENSRNDLSQVFAQWGMSGVAMEEFDRVVNVLREAYISKEVFDVCLIDVSYSSSSDKAFELLGQIRQEFAVDEVALVMLTAQGEPGDARRARDLGVQAYLTKPISPEDMHLTMQSIISAMSDDTTGLLTKHTLKEGERQNTQRVLLVEQDEMIRKQLLKSFSKASMLVDIASDNMQFGVAVKNNDYNAIFIDTALPGLDVFQFVADYRNKESLSTNKEKTSKQSAIIGLLNTKEGHRSQEYLTAGMDDVLCKPIDYLKLAVCISNYLSIKSTNTPKKPSPPL